MALLGTCYKCGKTINRHRGAVCSECSGAAAAARKEAERWASLSLEQKVDELTARVDAIQQAMDWDEKIR